MRIKLFTKIGNLNYLNLIVLLKTPRKRISSKVIIDTGSPSTIISYSDAMDLQIPISGLPKGSIVSLGGRKYQGYTFRKLRIKLRIDSGEDIEEEIKVEVVKPTSQKDMELLNMPTIIGNDFLEEKRLKLFCNFAEEEAYLERD